MSKKKMLRAISQIGTTREGHFDAFAVTDTFVQRHIGPSETDVTAMLSTLGFDSLDALIDSTIPANIRSANRLDTLQPPKGEQEALAALKALADQNIVNKSFIGLGYHGTVTPGVIKRNLFENPGWYTAYTPYQAELSQGRLESLLNFQTLMTDLTGLPYSCASLLDEGTAAAEAMAMAYDTSRQKRKKFFVSSSVHPQTLDCVTTRANSLGIDVVVGDVFEADFSGNDFSGVLVQYPGTLGEVPDYTSVAAAAAASKTLMIAAADPLALTVLKPPGEWGAQVVVGSAQRFGVPMFFGGPHAGFLTCTEKLMRRLPGRMIGVSKDSRGQPALRMALQAREQHIRRDKATSNICTAQALLANGAAMYAIYHGPEGLRRIATRVHVLARMFARALDNAGVAGLSAGQQMFDTVAVRLAAGSAADVAAAAAAAGLNIRVAGPDSVTVSFDETHSPEDVQALLAAFGVGVSEAQLQELAAEAGAQPLGGLPSGLVRTSEFCTHPVFNSHHSETEMLRYMRLLESKDLALNHSMISLGSCTMKLNATSEMEPVLWPQLANLHPFAPPEQTRGSVAMVQSLTQDLLDATGFAAMSHQPNSGANGEYAGLLCIKAYHEARGEGHRNVCLIPVSAHGTNPASAAMAGLKVVVVKSDDKGNVDLEDLRAKAEKHKDQLSALMITYPSTYGVFEEGVREIIDVVHGCGGQVYMDGANMNAQVGFTSPGDMGADVCHLNLHKTFCIPHGGGGPGVGSIGVAAHLAPYLPGHPVVPVGGDGLGASTVTKTTGAVAAAQYGSAGILPISWMYIKMMGSSGLKAATATAILNANYMAKRLEDHYDILFRGANGQCAHEFIIDLRKFKPQGVVEEDVAKRLQDYGFHAPTMSWPVPGTLMVEPTESEPRAELDRFCDAMISIRAEIDDVVEGRIDKLNNPLKNAPHTADTVMAENWDRPYSRTVAAFPLPYVRLNKFWPSVGRLDSVYGDRNLICTCPPLEDYLDQE